MLLFKHIKQKEGSNVENPKKAIMFIHGYMGSYNQFNDIRKQLENCGADLIFHILEGHESTFDEFLQTDADTWQSGVEVHIDRIRNDYDEIILVGHSMGGLLATTAAVHNPDKIKAIVAIGYPISIHFTGAWFKNGYLATLPYQNGEDPRVTASRKFSGVPVKGKYETIRAYPRGIQFMKTMFRARADLDKLTVPLSVINFKKDEIVARAAAGFVHKKCPTAKFYISKESYHFYFTNEDIKKMVFIIREVV